MAETKGTVEALAREEIPEDLGTVPWAVLQKTAKRTLGINPRQKRPMLEFAVNAELGRECVPPEPEPVPERERPPEPFAAQVERLEAEMAEMHEDPEDDPPRPHVNVEGLPDLTRGERPPEPEAPAPPAPPVQAPEPVEEYHAEAEVDPETVEDMGEKFPDPPVLFYSSIAKLNIIVSVGKRGYHDQDRVWHESIPGTSCHFGMNGNQEYTFKATKPWQVKAVLTSVKFKRGLCWLAQDEMKSALATARANVAALEARLEGADSATIQERMRAAMGGVPVVQGARNTRSSGAVIPLGDAPPWDGLDNLMNRQDRFGAAARDAMTQAQARGEI